MEINAPYIDLKITDPTAAVIGVISLVAICGYIVYKHIEGKEAKGENITLEGFIHDS